MTLFYTENLVKRFGGLLATDHVSIKIKQGEIHALIGPNGAGKSTLVNLISGVLSPDEGRMVLHNLELNSLSTHQRVQAGLGRCFQVTNIFKESTVLENLLLAVQAFNGSSFKFFAQRHNETYLYEKAYHLAEQFSLIRRINQMAGTLPHGLQRRLDVAMAAAAEPKLLLLDEPMAGMGPEDVPSMLQLIRQLNEHTTILLIEHDMDTVFELADQVSVLVYGKVLKTGTAEQIKQDKRVQEVYLGAEN